jgi:hypothetical protein
VYVHYKCAIFQCKIPFILSSTKLTNVQICAWWTVWNLELLNFVPLSFLLSLEYRYLILKIYTRYNTSLTICKHHFKYFLNFWFRVFEVLKNGLSRVPKGCTGIVTLFPASYCYQKVVRILRTLLKEKNARSNVGTPSIHKRISIHEIVSIYIQL